MAADSLKKLHTDLVDNRNGYEEAVKDDEPPLKAFFAEMVALKDNPPEAAGHGIMTMSACHSEPDIAHEISMSQKCQAQG